MAAASNLDGYSLAQADLLRGAMGENDAEKICVCRGEWTRMGISIRPTDINKSGLKCMQEMWEVLQRPDSRGTKATATLPPIRYGRTAIKRVGESPMEAVVRDPEHRGD